MSSKEIFPFVFLIGIILFNWPVLEVFHLSLPYYLFGIWALLIFVIGVVLWLKTGDRDDRHDSDV